MLKVNPLNDRVRIRSSRDALRRGAEKHAIRELQLADAVAQLHRFLSAGRGDRHQGQGKSK